MVMNAYGGQCTAAAHSTAGTVLESANLGDSPQSHLLTQNEKNASFVEEVLENLTAFNEPGGESGGIYLMQ